MSKYFFTFSEQEGQPYHDGWTEVEAPDLSVAIRAFACFHPNKESWISCESYYTEDDFESYEKKKRLAKGGHGCHERIRATREVDVIGYLKDDPVTVTETLFYSWEAVDDPGEK